jgi:hypothetical protein
MSEPAKPALSVCTVHSLLDRIKPISLQLPTSSCPLCPMFYNWYQVVGATANSSLLTSSVMSRCGCALRSSFNLWTASGSMHKSKSMSLHAERLESTGACQSYATLPSEDASCKQLLTSLCQLVRYWTCSAAQRPADCGATALGALESRSQTS